MQLRIETFDNAKDGNAFYKAVTHPLAARRAAPLMECLRSGGPVAVYDPLGFADGFAAVWGLAADGFSYRRPQGAVSRAARASPSTRRAGSLEQPFPGASRFCYPSLMAKLARPEVIVQNPDIQAGALTFRGTRILVRPIAEALAQGVSEAELKSGYPTLTSEMLKAAHWFRLHGDLTPQRLSDHGEKPYSVRRYPRKRPAA